MPGYLIKRALPERVGRQRRRPRFRDIRASDDLRYSWLEDYLARLDGKESRREYYARLEEGWR